jgi:hypothetical protein
MDDGQSDASSPELTPAQLQFHMEEYKSLRAEIAMCIKAQFDAFLYALVSNGGIMAWLLTHRDDLAAYGFWEQKFIALVPVLVTALALLWTFYYTKNIQRLSAYIRLIERRAGAPGLGWDNFLSDMPDTTFGLRVPRRMALCWLLLALAGVGFALGA